MANPFSQRVRQRKVIYFALILVLLFVSVLHRQRMLEPMATRLKLREVAKGEVELTSAAVRLSLTGSRGLAVNFLWSTALRQQERHEWNKLELVIGAITKLQPYFITPWLFQGWNLAYNVSVECDRPHDKYYYVSRGLTLLAEGERRNLEQSVDPKEPGVGQPDLRHFIGVAYQGKFGSSDEKTTMRCLLEMSCIDPVQRDPARFWTIGKDGRKAVNLEELYKLCRDHPRLVRRLRDKLEYTDPRQIVAFLTDNRKLPTRFEKPTGGRDQQKTPIKENTRDQFPILPPAQGDRVPNPSPNLVNFGLGQESIDVFVISRAWFDYAQQPLPPPSPDPSVEYKFDPLKHRLPKSPAMSIFRSFPARARAYSAEVMEEEGWFDADGWLIDEWFAQERFQDGDDVRVGDEVKYHAGPAWERAFQAYLKLGVEAGQYLSPKEEAAQEVKAAPFRKKYKVTPEVLGPPVLPAEDRLDKVMHGSWLAHQRLNYRAYTSRLTNFDAHYYHAEAERTPEQVTARKLFHQAEHLRRFKNPEQALSLFEAAWPYWMGTCLRFPKFSEQSNNQEDAYELQLKHLRLMQKQHPALYRTLATDLAELTRTDLTIFKAALVFRAFTERKEEVSVRPHLPLEDLLDPGDKSRVAPIRTVRGWLDSARVYQVPEKDALSRAVLAWTQAAGTPRLFLFPGQEQWTLVAVEVRDRELQRGWAHLVDEGNIRMVRSRLGLIPLEATPESVPANVGPPGAGPPGAGRP